MDSEKSLEDDGHFNSETNVESSPLGLEEQYHDKCVQVRPTAMSNRPEQRPPLQRCDYLRFLKEVINEIILSLTEGQGGGIRECEADAEDTHPVHHVGESPFHQTELFLRNFSDLSWRPRRLRRALNFYIGPNMSLHRFVANS